MVLGYFIQLITHTNAKAATKTADQTDAMKQSVAKDRGFQMPLHYPRYSKSDYEKMEEWRLDLLFKQYGLDSYCDARSLDAKRAFAIGTFLWPDQL